MFRIVNLLALICLSISAMAADSMATGTVIGRHIFGLATNANDEPLLVDEVPLIFPNSEFDLRVEAFGATSVISGFGDAIGGLYLTRLDSDAQHPVDTSALQTGELGGISKPRGGITTPWNSVLFGEAEYIDAANPRHFINAYKPFYKGKGDLVKPYNYGWVDEAIVLDKQGSAKVIKNYALGRVSASQLTMMPDGKSLYLFDQENHGLLYLFVSDGDSSLTSGTLYGISLDGGNVDYIKLGSSSALKMKFKLKRISFKALFDSVPLKDGVCADGYVPVGDPVVDECLKVVKKNRRYVGLFEPARMLAIKRHGQELTRFTQVTFTNDKVELTTRAGVSRHYALMANDKIGSQYIMQGAK
jgi:hypothetical protein